MRFFSSFFHIKHVYAGPEPAQPAAKPIKPAPPVPDSDVQIAPVYAGPSMEKPEKNNTPKPYPQNYQPGEDKGFMV